MTREELMAAPTNAPVWCKDGKFGLLIRWWEDGAVAGVQVPGEEDIRSIPCETLTQHGDGALQEL